MDVFFFIDELYLYGEALSPIFICSFVVIELYLGETGIDSLCCLPVIGEMPEAAEAVSTGWILY